MQDTAAVARYSSSVLGRMAAGAAGAVGGGAGSMAAGAPGWLAWIGAAVGSAGVNALRDAGIRNFDDAMREALLNPAFARTPQLSPLPEYLIEICV